MGDALTAEVRPFKPGDRVRWAADEGDPPDMVAARGTVRAATADELAYVATWATSARMSVHGHVIVVWDGAGRHGGAWTDPDDLQLAEEP